MSRVGFIGLGNMGRHMAANLIKKGESVIVFDLNKSAAEGMNLATLPEIFKKSNVIFSMLPDGSVVEKVLSDQNIESMDRSCLFVDCSTIEFSQAKSLQQKLAKVGRRFIDAPVSGGVPGAEAATLSFMVGGTAEDYEEVKPKLLKMGSTAFHCGPVGSGQLTKMVNNLMLAISMLGISEVFHLGMKAGLDPSVILKVLNSSTGKCWVTEKYCPVPGQQSTSPASKDYNGGFASKLMLKDLKIAESAFKKLGSHSVLGTETIKAYEKMIEATPSLGSKDFSVVFRELFQKNAK